MLTVTVEAARWELIARSLAAQRKAIAELDAQALVELANEAGRLASEINGLRGDALARLAELRRPCET